MRNVSSKCCRENQNTQFKLNTFFLENHTFYEIMWENTVEPYRPHMTTWRMRIDVGYSRLQKHTQNMWYILISDCNNSCTNASQFCVILLRTVHCLSRYNELVNVTCNCKYDTGVIVDSGLLGCDAQTLVVLHVRKDQARATLSRPRRYEPQNTNVETSNISSYFDVLLTVHFSIFILVINQLDAQNFVLQ